MESKVAKYKKGAHAHLSAPPSPVGVVAVTISTKWTV